ncbi:diacylglycerol kinase family protein [Cellulomonas sp. KRMCY2]|uniref:diacylglycerol/lipid kinase family protein n=1 Tax=Cellulomonas sp. KRMCY2 TaxID=1304865 RepID=UPI0004B4E2BB|nr:diacylglycerol kinase family protein [Cellulomonas sp. KRMCY2]
MTGITIGVVVNPTAGHGRGSVRGHHLLTAARRRGHTLVDLTADDLASATQHVRQAIVHGLDALVVVGGDGMVHLGVNVVAETDLPLGIVAAGSGNDVARAMGLPRHDVGAAVRAIESGLETGGRPVDAVIAGPPDYSAHEWYLGVLSGGLDAAVNARANDLTWPRGGGRYVRALLAEVTRFRPYGYRITLDDEVWESTGSLVAVANGGWFGGGMRIAPDARMDDGLLDVVIVGPLGRIGLMSVFPRIYAGTHIQHPACTVLRSRTVLIEPSPTGPMPPAAFADGERLGPLPLRAEVRPGAVRLLA